MRRAAIFVAAMAFAPAAHAAPPAVSVQVSPGNGPAPLQVTLTASGDLALYRWDLGDGAAADGPSVQHTYAAEGSPRVSPPRMRSARPPRRPPRSPRSGSRSRPRASGATSRSCGFKAVSSRHSWACGSGSSAASGGSRPCAPRRTAVSSCAGASPPGTTTISQSRRGRLECGRARCAARARHSVSRVPGGAFGPGLCVPRPLPARERRQADCSRLARYAPCQGAPRERASADRPPGPAGERRVGAYGVDVSLEPTAGF